jgi:cytochrome P450
MDRETDATSAVALHRRGAPPRIELAELAAHDDPHPSYERLRAAGPVARAGLNQWLVTRYAEVAQLLESPALEQFQVSAILKRFPAQAAIQEIARDPAVQFTERILAGRDGEEHKELRRCLTRALKASLAQLDPIIASELAALWPGIRRRGRFEVVNDIAFPLPMRVLGRIVGVPATLQDSVARSSLKLALVFSPEYATAERQGVNDAISWLRGCVSDLVATRRRRGSRSDASSFIDRLLAENAQRWDHADIVDNIIFVLFAGFETSLNLLSGGFDALLKFPEQQRKLRRTPSLAPQAVEEFLRFNSPVHITGRVAAEPFRVGEQHISAGRIVYLALASANRDAEAFEAPNLLDIERKPNRHLAFGGGPHYCLGAAVARREAILTFATLPQELGWMEPSGEAVRARSATLRSIHQLEVSIASGTR